MANIYLHYVFDLWVQAWRRKRAQSGVITVRYADDIVVGFQSEADAKRFRAELTERFRKFQLELHPDKTRLLEVGRYAADNREQRGERKPETSIFSALRISAERREATDTSRCCGKRFAKGCKRS